MRVGADQAGGVWEGGEERQVQQPTADRASQRLDEIFLPLPEVMKTNDWDQPEIQYSTGASNQAFSHRIEYCEDALMGWTCWTFYKVTLKVELVIVRFSSRADQLHHAGGAVGRHQGMVGGLRCPSFAMGTEAVLERELLLYHRPGHGRCHGPQDILRAFYIKGFSAGGLIEIQRFFPDTLYW